MQKKCPQCGKPLRAGFTSCMECGWGIMTEQEAKAQGISQERKARLERATRLECQSNIALILAIIALIVSCIR